jgi:hypothetical protein
MARIERAVRALQVLTWRQRVMLLRAWLLLPAVAVGLRLLGFRRVRGVLSGRQRPATRHDLAEAETVARLVRTAAAWSRPRPSCLTRSLVLERLLRGWGLASALRIGVERPGTFAAHAWVEHAGVALGEPEGVPARYAVFAGALDGPGPLMR